MTTAEALNSKYKREDSFWSQQGLTLGNIRFVAGFTFKNFIINIRKNNVEMRFDIFLAKQVKLPCGKTEEINMQLVKDFQEYFGKGFYIKVLSDNENDLYVH